MGGSIWCIGNLLTAPIIERIGMQDRAKWQNSWVHSICSQSHRPRLYKYADMIGSSRSCTWSSNLGCRGHAWRLAPSPSPVVLRSLAAIVQKMHDLFVNERFDILAIRRDGLLLGLCAPRLRNTMAFAVQVWTLRVILWTIRSNGAPCAAQNGWPLCFLFWLLCPARFLCQLSHHRPCAA